MNLRSTDYNVDALTTAPSRRCCTINCSSSRYLRFLKKLGFNRERADQDKRNHEAIYVTSSNNFTTFCDGSIISLMTVYTNR